MLKLKENKGEKINLVILEAKRLFLSILNKN